MFRSSLTVLVLPLLLLVGTSSDNSAARPKQKNTEIQTETVEKMIASTGTVAMEVDLNRLNDTGTKTEPSTPETARFTLAPDSFFTIIVTDDVFRSSLPGSISLIPQSSITVPAPLSASLRQLSLEKKQTGAAYEMVVRDSKSGFLFFNVEGHSYDYEASKHLFSIDGGRLIVSEEFAAALGRPAQAGSVVGKISLSATMLTIERTGFVNGEATSDVMPSSGTFPGPDVIVGDLNGLAQFDGSSGTQVGLAVGTDSCNAGTVDLDWFATPDNNHPVIPQNMYRMSGGATNDERFEQIGQSNAKHAFTALTENICGLGCNGTGGTHLGSGCSDPYVAGLNSGQSNHNLGSRAWINPFTGAFPRGDSATPPNNHAGHTHTGPAHRILVEINDLNTSLNPGATYYAEAQYVTPHEYVWCQAHGQCNMYNNVSYRRYNVSGTASPFTFTTGGFTTQRMQAAISAWPGAAVNKFEPAPGIDGIGYVGVKVTNPSAGVWHYEYAIYNQNIDRAIQSFSVPIGPGVTISNIGFHAPPQHPGWAADGTVGDAGYSSTPWTPTQTANSVTWNSQTFAANQNANAIRWGTLYNFRFDANLAPLNTSATIGFFKTGSPMAVDIQAPVPPPTPTPTPTPIPTPTPLPPTPTPSPTLTPIPSGVAVSLPTAMIDTSINNFVRPVTVSNVNASDNLIGFQADFTFDQTIATFQSPPVSAAGLTATNWNVSGNVLPGAGPIRTLRVSSFSTDGVTPLSGSGTLFSLNMTRVSSTSGATTALTWAPPPNDFAFYDTDLNAHTPSDETAGSITIQTVVSISGAVDYCSNPSLNAVPGVTMTLSGSASGSTLSDGSGNYSFASLASGGSYTVTPSKTALVAGSAGITTVDVLAVQRHFLGITLIPAGCRLTAADVTGDTAVTTVDVVAVQRFFLGFTAGTANAGKYSFSPANRTYPSVGGNQTSQNYDALVFGDVASSFVHRPGGSSPEAANEIVATVAMISLPEIAADHSRNFVAPVTTTAIDAANKLVGFQGDLTFDERMVRFENNPVQKAGLTAGNWNVSGNVLDGPGPIRTLRVSAYSTDFQPLAGKGTLFELRMVNAGNGAQSTPLVWSASPNQFIFIDADLNIQRPGNAPAGNVKR